MKTAFKWLAVMFLPLFALVAIGAPSEAHAATTHFSTFGSGSALIGVAGVTNVLGNYNETFFAQEALIQLEKVMGLAGRVYRDYSANPQVKGDTIQVRRPSSFTAADAPAAASNLNTESVAITLNKWKEVKFALTDKDLALSSDRIISDHIRPAAVALADQIDTDLAALYKQVPWHSTMQATPVLGDVSKIRKIMFDNKVPMNDGMLNLMIDGATEVAFLNAMAASGMQPNQQDTSLRNASIGRLFGFDTWANQNTPIHTSGVAADATGTVDGVNAVGATTVTISAVTAGITVKAGDILTIAGDTQAYNVAADATDADGAAFPITITPALKKATAGTEVVTIFLGGASKAQNLAFHRNFAALATAPLSDLGNELGARIKTIADPKTGLALRSRVFYMGDTSEVRVALDILYGVKVLDPNLAVRGDAA